MRDYSKVGPQFWIGETGRFLRGHKEAQIVCTYVLTAPSSNMLGLYHLPITTLIHDTGLTEKEAWKGLRRAIEGGFCSYDEASEVIFVHEMARFQIGDRLKADDKRCKGVQNEYNSLIRNPFLSVFYDKYSSAFCMTAKRENESPSKGPCKPLRSQEQEQEQEQDKSSASFDAVSYLSSKGVPDQIIQDWIALRKMKKAKITRTAITGIEREVAKTSLSLADALTKCCERNWTGFDAAWIGPQHQGRQEQIL